MLHTQTQRITAHIPINLLHAAQEATGKGITETLKIALLQLTRAVAYEDFRKRRGKIRFSIALDALRKERDKNTI
jgi:hypothetical protein